MKIPQPSIMFLLTSLSVIQFSISVQASYWDVADPNGPLPADVTLSSGSPTSLYGDQKMAANNGVVYVIGTVSGNPAVCSWSQCNGWQVLASFQFLNGETGLQSVNAIVVHGNKLYVGGLFDTVYPAVGSSVSANNVAMIDTQSGICSSIGTTFSTSLTDSNICPIDCANIVACLTVDNATNVYVGLLPGDNGFSAGQVSPLVQMLAFGQNTWQPLGAGLIGPDYTDPNDPTGIHQCGMYSEPIFNIAAMDTDGTNIFVAGQFDGGQNTSGTNIISPSIIKWNATSNVWQNMGVGIYPPSYVNQGICVIYSLAVAGTNVFACGDYRMKHYVPNLDNCAFDVAPSAGTNVSRFSTSGTYLGTAGLTIDGGQWEGIDATGLPSQGVCLRAQGLNVFLLGNFDHVGNTAATNVAEWFKVGSRWSALDTGIQIPGIELGNQNYIATDANAVYVLGGDIYQVGGMMVTNNICRWAEGSFPDNVTLTSNGSSGVSWTYCGTNPMQWLVEECSIPNPTSWLWTGFVDAEVDGSTRSSNVTTGGMYVRVIGGYWDGSEYVETGPVSNVILWNN